MWKVRIGRIMPKTLHKFQTKEWRCTRPTLYTSDCPGRDNPRARQGHYIAADSPREARAIMADRFPDDGGNFDMSLWSDDGIVYLTTAEYLRRVSARGASG